MEVTVSISLMGFNLMVAVGTLQETFFQKPRSLSTRSLEC